MKLIRHLFPYALAVLLFGLTQCDKISQVEHNVTSKAITFDLPAHDAGDYELTQIVNMNFDSLVSQYDLGLVSLTSVRPESATLSIIDTDATPVTFDILDLVEMDLATASMASRKIAWKDPVPHTGLTSIAFDVAGSSELLDFASANAVIVTLKARLNTALTHPIKMKLEVRYHIIAHL
ncbi:MAG: hypothetical protein WCR72_03725 [Bacteroidota bacterium]